MELWLGAFNLGLIYSFLAIGVFITSRILDFPDITVDGSFTTGAAVTAVLIVLGVNPLITVLLSFLAGMLCGYITGLIHTRFKVNCLLAGILVMTGLYSINLHIMGKSNIPLMTETTIFTFLQNSFIRTDFAVSIFMTLIVLLVWLLISLFFKSDLGMTLRSTGDNPVMTSANGVNVDSVKIMGVAISNGFVALAGSFVAQYQGFADIGMGIGTMVIGLASVIVGGVFIKKRAVSLKLLSVIIGAIVYRYIIASALFVGMNPVDLKLITALFVLLTIIFSGTSYKSIKKKFSPKLLISSSVILSLLLAGYIAYKAIIIPGKNRVTENEVKRIGIVQINRNGILDITREAYIAEMKRIGYEDAFFDFLCADGDMTNLNTILDKFSQEKCDLILTISTPATQAAINKIKDIPVVFATVANPFIVGAGTNDEVHLPNVTGSYGWVDMNVMVDMFLELMSGKVNIGTLGNSSEANTEFYLQILRERVKNSQNLKLIERSVTGANDVYEAAMAVAESGADVFILPVDSIVFASFEAIAKVAKQYGIPVFTSDPKKLENGAFLCYGHDYAQSGVQAAHLTDKIFQGTSPENIPFVKYEKDIIGLNYPLAKELGIEFTEKLKKISTEYIDMNNNFIHKIPKIGLVTFSEHPIFEVVQKGVLDGIASGGYVNGINYQLIEKSANGDFSLINPIIQDFLKEETDIIVPLSTPCLQSAIQLSGKATKPEVIFTFVTDPFAAGAGKDMNNHLANVTGFSCMNSFDEVLEAIRVVFPEKKKIGIAWNPSEANSQTSLTTIRKLAPKYNFEILEASINSSADVAEAANSLIVKGAEIFLCSGDNTLNTAFPVFVKIAEEKEIPVISDNEEHIKLGALLAIGVDYYQNGYDAGEYVVRVLSGESAAELPIQNTSQTSYIINEEVAKKHKWIIPDSIKNRSEKFSTSSKKKVAVFHFIDQQNALDSVQGVLDELNKDGFAKNLIIEQYSAQGETTLAQTIVQDIIRKQYDYAITISTPALQYLANQNKTIPHIFGTVTDPYKVGVAESSTNHFPNLTGLATLQPVESTIKLMREIFPNAKKIGIVWCTSEVCSEVCTGIARESAAKYGFSILESSVTSTTEVIDATNALVGKIDLFFTSGDNVVELSVETIAEILHKNKIPYFTNSPAHIKSGSFVSVGADYYDVGKETGKLAKEVIKGKNPKDIPIKNFVPEKIAVNLKLAKEYKVKIPAQIIKQAQIVVE